MISVFALAGREILRFLRQPSRVLGIIGSPVLFWFVIGSGLRGSFQFASAPPAVDYLEYFFPGTVVLVVMFTSVFSTISIIEDRREGFLQSVLAAPVARSVIVLGKTFGVAVLSLFQGILVLLLGPVAGFPFSPGSLLLAVAVLFLVALMLGHLGFLIAWRMDSTQGFHAVMNLLLIPLWMLSGALFPTTGAVRWLGTVMDLNPLTYGVAAVRMCLYGLRQEYTKDLPELWISLTVVCVTAMVLFVFCVVSVKMIERGEGPKKKALRLFRNL